MDAANQAGANAQAPGVANTQEGPSPPTIIISLYALMAGSSAANKARDVAVDQFMHAQAAFKDAPIEEKDHEALITARDFRYEASVAAKTAHTLVEEHIH